MNPEYSHPARSHLWCASCRCLEESAQRRLLYAYPGTPEIEATLLYLCPSVRARLFPPSPPLFFSLVRPIAHARIRACVRACVVNRGKREILYFCQPGIVRLIVRFRDWNLSKSFFSFRETIENYGNRYRSTTATSCVINGVIEIAGRSFRIILRTSCSCNREETRI